MFALVILALWGLGAQAADVVLVVDDGARRGFNDPTPVAPVGGNDGATLGEQRRIAFSHAAAVLASRVASSVPIRIRAVFDASLSCRRNAATLASASPATFTANFASAPRGDTFYPVALANALQGRRISNTDRDIVARFNPGLDEAGDCLRGSGWYYGIDGATPAGQPSFVSTVVHELTHGLGFVSLVALDDSGDTRAGQFPRASSGARYPDIYSARLQDLAITGQPFWPGLSDAQRRQSLTHGASVVFAGASTVSTGAPQLENGVNQGRVRVYAPEPIERASSISHWDPSVAPDQIMAPVATGAARVARGIGLSSCVLQDIGWSLSGMIRCPDNSRQAIAGDMTAADVAIVGSAAAAAASAPSGDDDDAGSGGGCTLTPGTRFDPLWVLLLAGAAAALLRRSGRA